MPDTRPRPPEPAQPLHFTASRDYSRFDICIASEVTSVTRAAARHLIIAGAALVNGSPSRPSHPVRQGDRVSLTLPAPTSAPEPEPWALTAVYEDDHIVVVDKPAGLVVHPAPGHSSETLVNMLLDAYSDLPGADESRPGIVHRLDKDTSGLLIVAKTEHARTWLVEQFKEAGIHKTYLALVLGHPEQSGMIDQPIARHPVHRKKMAVVPGGRRAITSYTVCEYLTGFALVAAQPETGRTHQLRVHFAHTGHPIAGDQTYGGRPARQALKGVLTRQFLHAHRLVFTPPWMESALDLSSPLPADLQEALRYARTLHD
jgi:23S rRNA pseudouridine1911/1915/1917 synthase